MFVLIFIINVSVMQVELYLEWREMHFPSYDFVVDQYLSGPGLVYLWSLVRASLHWASALMLWQLCDDASDTVLIEN